jgi:hypothetical protein
MLVTLKGSVTGTRNGTAWPPRGSTVDLPEDEARGLIASGMGAEPEKGATVTPFDTAPDHAALVNDAVAFTVSPKR